MQRHPPKILVEQPRQRQATDTASGRLPALIFQPDRTFRHAPHQAKHDHRRHDAGPQHEAPRPLGPIAHQRVRQLINDRRQQESGGVSALQNPGGDAAVFRGPLLEGQWHTGGPHPAHADAKEAPHGEQHHVGRRHAAQQRKRRVPGDREQDWPLAAKAIRECPGADAAEHPEEERDRAQRTGQCLVHSEALLDINQDEREDGEVEGIKRPRGERGEEGFPLLTADFAVPRLRHGH